MKDTKGLVFIIRFRALELNRLCRIVPVNNCEISLALFYLDCSNTQASRPGQSTYPMALSFFLPLLSPSWSQPQTPSLGTEAPWTLLLPSIRLYAFLLCNHGRQERNDVIIIPNYCKIYQASWPCVQSLRSRIRAHKFCL